MNTNNIHNQELTDADFDKWLGETLKISAVEPPINFTQKVMLKIPYPDAKVEDDPTLILIVAAIALLMAMVLVVKYLLPTSLLDSTGLSFIYELVNNSWRFILNCILVIVAGAGLFGVDQLLLQRGKRDRLALQP